MKSIPLTQGKIALVDDEDFDRLGHHKWYFALGYARRNISNKRGQRPLLLHRVIMGAKRGQIVDHINGNKLDNQKSNLRFVNYFENAWNRPCEQASKSGLKGVHWYKRYNKWHAAITAYGKRTSIGYFVRKEDAALAYIKKSQQLHGAFSPLCSMNKQSVIRPSAFQG